MKLYLCVWTTNHGEQSFVISALNKENAITIAKKSGAWYNVHAMEIIPSLSEGIVSLL